ncbi:MAG: peptide deformylase [Candidatus Omnitrophica bacterium]|nr:peptide deformylase [Candidatus Omnitrophota bacterium]
MQDLKIRKFPESILRKKAAKVGKVTEDERSILSEMADVMYLSQGVGLAAVQVGIDKQLAVIDIGEGLIKLVNPVIVKKDGIEAQEEGCLSCPGLTVKIKRAKKVVVNFLNENGDFIELKAEGLLARAVQHELDHLLGKLIIDYLSPVKKLLARKKLSRKNGVEL